MLRFFRINDPYRLLAVLAVVIALGLTLLLDAPPQTIRQLHARVVGQMMTADQQLYTELWDTVPPLQAVFDQFCFWVFGPSATARQILALIFVFVQASYFAIFLIRAKAYTENTYLPALLFVVTAFYSFDTFQLTPELFSSFFLLLALGNLFREIEFRQQRDATIFNLGIYLSLASLTVFVHAIFLPVALVVLLLFAQADARKIVLLILGFLLPHMALAGWYFIHDGLGLLWSHYYHAQLTRAVPDLVPGKTMLVFCALPLVYLVFALFMMSREARLTRYQTQLLQAMLLWQLGGMIMYVLVPGLQPASLLPLLPPWVYLTSYYLLLIRRKWLAELSLWFFVVGTVALSLLARHGKLSYIDYSALVVTPSPRAEKIAQKKVMILADDLALYDHNQPASFFLDWSVSQAVFEDPDAIGNILLLDRCFQHHTPEVIVDPGNYLSAIIVRLPRLQGRYQRQDENWLLISK
ncbi:MAG: DUF6427 family protein [Cyclobacteriaceae bacterium]|nr:DUF6427 family protein [Cyclobacteriaceae bacterium]